MVKRAVSFTFPVPLFDPADEPVGVAPALSVSKDGGSFVASTSGTVAIPDFGCTVTLTASEMDAGVITAKLAAGDAQQQIVYITTEGTSPDLTRKMLTNRQSLSPDELTTTLYDDDDVSVLGTWTRVGTTSPWGRFVE